MDVDRTARLRGGLDDALSNLMAVLPGADNEPGWDIHTGEEEAWSVREMLAHLAISEASMNQLIDRALTAARESQPGDLPVVGRDGRPFELDTWNRRQVAKRADQPPSALRLELTETRTLTLRKLKGLSGAELGAPAWHPALGATTVESIYKVIGVHMRDHTRAIKKALRSGLQGRYWADVE